MELFTLALTPVARSPPSLLQGHRLLNWWAYKQDGRSAEDCAREHEEMEGEGRREGGATAAAAAAESASAPGAPTRVPGKSAEAAAAARGGDGLAIHADNAFLNVNLWVMPHTDAFTTDHGERSSSSSSSSSNNISSSG